MQTHQRYTFQQSNVVRFVVKASLVVVFGLFILGAVLGVNVTRTYAQTSSTALAAGANGNAFPYGACTWWANERYHQLHHRYVPWTTNAHAWQWKDRAHDFHWHVSSRPKLGAIIDLQPYVQGASWLGHVGVVERVLKNGHVIASSMSWGANPYAVTKFQFRPGPGVTFISR